jgi:hypothetical protein
MNWSPSLEELDLAAGDWNCSWSLSRETCKRVSATEFPLHLSTAACCQRGVLSTAVPTLSFQGPLQTKPNIPPAGEGDSSSRAIENSGAERQW